MNPNRTLALVAMLAGCATQRLSPNDRDPSDADQAKQAALDWLDQTGGLDGVDELVPLSVEFDGLGMAHVRFQQLERGVPVSGGQVVVHLAPSGEVDTTTDRLLRDLGVDPQPALDARSAAPEARGTLSTSTLEVVRHQGREVLAWRHQFEARGAELSRDVVVVDANTGDELFRYDNLQSARNRRTFDANNGESLPGTLARTENQGPVGDRPVDDAHTFAGVTYDYYDQEQNRDSWDGAGGQMISSAHYSFQLENAFWDGTQVIFGDGGTFLRPLSQSLEVVGHEFTHAVTERTAGLIYAGESGGLNEATSDIMGAVISSFHQNFQVDDDTWLIGEEIARPALGDSLRRMDDPTADGISIDDYGDYFDGLDVHFSSGIANKAFFLMATDGALDIDEAGDIWYRALVFYMTPSTTFPQASEATVQAAIDLFGDGSPQVEAVTEAWAAVGIQSFDPFFTRRNQAATTGNEIRFEIQKPAGATALQFSTSGGTGDVDLYVLRNSPPSTTVSDCRSEGPATTESCVINAPRNGSYHILLSSFATFSGVTLTVSSAGTSPAQVLTVGDLAAGDLVITEFMANPGVASDDVGEWIEVHNPGTDDIDLDGLRIQDEDGNEGQVTGETIVTAGGFALLGRRSAADFEPAALNPDGFYGSQPALNNTGGDRVRIFGPAVLIDQTFLFQQGAAVSGRARQLDPLLLDAQSNNQGANWCRSTDVAPGGDRGTPGEPNTSCP